MNGGLSTILIVPAIADLQLVDGDETRLRIYQGLPLTKAQADQQKKKRKEISKYILFSNFKLNFSTSGSALLGVPVHCLLYCTLCLLLII